MSNNKILITGGAGFIGSNLAETLMQRDYRIAVVDNFDSYYDPQIKKNNLELLIRKNVPIYEINILNKRKLEEVFQMEKFDKIIHLAAKAGVVHSLKNPEEYEKVNVLGTINLIKLSIKYRLKQFIFISSSSVYGDTNTVPFREDDVTIEPTSPYGLTKKNAESFCRLYSRLYNMPIVCFRLFTVYGPRQRPEMAIHKFIKKLIDGKEIIIYGDGQSLRDYTYISDIIDGIINCLEKDLEFEIINLGRGSPIKLLDLVSVLEKKLNKNAQIRFRSFNDSEMKITYADIGKAQKFLNYKPIMSIEDGIDNFLAWYDETSF